MNEINEMMDTFKNLLGADISNFDNWSKHCEIFNKEVDKFEKLKESYDKASLRQIVIKCRDRYENQLKLIRASENKKGFRIA